jgi:nanoRNase/pAp phosphatase (c-di-AMP/oligoRNAs hydrolase)
MDIEESRKALINFLSKKENENKIVYLLCHDDPDPDCIASCMAIKKIIESLKKDCYILYGGDISHHQTRIMLNTLNIDMIKIGEDEEVDLELKESIKNSIIGIVDTFHWLSGNCTEINKIIDSSLERLPDFCIDHHLSDTNIKNKFPICINDHVGSCSTLAVEFLQNESIDIQESLATALLLGIITDTNDLKSEFITDRDMVAYETLKKNIDLKLFQKIINYPRPVSYLYHREKAYSSLHKENSMAIAFAGWVNPKHRSILGELCQELCLIESIESSMVIGILDEGLDKNKYLIASLRSSEMTLDCSEFVQNVFGKKYSGGRKGVAAARVPINGPFALMIDYFNDENSEFRQDLEDSLFETYMKRVTEEKSKN